MAFAAVPILAITELPDPLTVTAHYLAPVPAGQIRVRARLLRKGRRLATARADLAQDDRLVLQGLGTFGDPAAPHSDVRFEVGLPELPPTACCGTGKATPSPLPARLAILPQ